MALRSGLGLVAWALARLPGPRLAIRFPLVALWPGLVAWLWLGRSGLGLEFVFLGGALAGPWLGRFRLGFGL